MGHLARGEICLKKGGELEQGEKRVIEATPGHALGGKKGKKTGVVGGGRKNCGERGGGKQKGTERMQPYVRTNFKKQ